MSHGSGAVWDNDLVQFARLICELEQNDAFTDQMMALLGLSMDLPVSRIGELIERANVAFEGSKARICPSSAPIEVACAVIIHVLDEPRVLMTQRLPSVDYAFCWEFPGGKLEPGEDALAALGREVQEELGCSVMTATPICDSDELTAGGRQVHMTFWEVSTQDVPHMLASIGLGWFTASELPLLNHTPGGRSVVDRIARLMENRKQRYTPKGRGDDAD